MRINHKNTYTLICYTNQWYYFKSSVIAEIFIDTPSSMITHRFQVNFVLGANHHDTEI